MTDNSSDPKFNAAKMAISAVKGGMIVGLGTGSTAKIAIDLLGAEVANGLKITGVPTSERSAQQAASLSIPLTTLDEMIKIDVTIDGADRVERQDRNLIKGLGGALLREKLVASSSQKLIIVVDDSKIKDSFDEDCPVPVEVVAFAWKRTLERLEQVCSRMVPRQGEGGLFMTDGGNHIIDCFFDKIENPARLHERLKSVTGVVETGLFIAMSPRVIVGTKDGAYELSVEA